MKWISLLWSVVLLGFIALSIGYVSSRPSQGIIGPAFGYALIVWITVSITSPVVVILRIFRIIRSASSFIYILMGTASICLGMLGLCYIVPTPEIKNKIGILSILSLNTLLGCYIYFDAFVTTIPGLREDRKVSK